MECSIKYDGNTFSHVKALLLVGMTIWSTSITFAQQAATKPTLIVTPSSDIASTGPPDGPFLPALFEYRVSASAGIVRYSVAAPPWLTAWPNSGMTDTAGVTITFIISPAAARLPSGIYGPAVAFANLTNGLGTTSRPARLTVRASAGPIPKAAPSKSPSSQGEYLLDDRGGYLLDDREERLLAR